MGHNKLAVIGGMGEGLGSALAHYFRDKGYQVIGLNRSLNNHVGKEIIQFKVDLSDQGQVRQALEEINLTHRVPDVFIHNAAELVIAPFDQTSVEQFEQCWRAVTLSAFVLSKELLPMMAEKGGTAIFTGATASINLVHLVQQNLLCVASFNLLQDNIKARVYMLPMSWLMGSSILKGVESYSLCLLKIC